MLRRAVVRLFGRSKWPKRLATRSKFTTRSFQRLRFEPERVGAFSTLLINQPTTAVRSSVSQSPSTKLSPNPMSPASTHFLKNDSFRTRITACGEMPILRLAWGAGSPKMSWPPSGNSIASDPRSIPDSASATSRRLRLACAPVAVFSGEVRVAERVLMITESGDVSDG